MKLSVSIARLYRKYWAWLGGVSALLTLIKLGDLVVPLLAGKVLESLGTASSQRTGMWLTLAVAVWLIHGNVVPWVCNSIDARKIELFARRDVSLWSLERAKSETGVDSTLLQTLIERGEAVIPDFLASVVRVLLPSILPCIAVIVALVVISPKLFLALAIGCGLYAAATLYMNSILMPRYVALQDADNKREQLRIKIFRMLTGPARATNDMIEAYGRRYAEVATIGSAARACYLNFDLSRGVIINLMNAATWIIGIHAVRTDQFGLAVFIAFVSWSSACISYVQSATDMHKKWLEIGPAIRNYFAAVGEVLPAPAKLEAKAGPMLQPAE